MKPKSVSYTRFALCMATCLLLAGVCVHAEEPTPPVDSPVNQPAVTATERLNILDAKITFIRTAAKVQSQDEGPVVIQLKSDKVKVQRRGSSTPEEVGVGTMIHPQDTIITDDRTTAQILLLDGSLIVLGPGTRLNISERTSTLRGVRTELTLYNGMIRGKISAIAARPGFKAVTTAMEITSDEPFSFVLRHREPKEVGKYGCCLVTLLTKTLLRINCLLHKHPLELTEIGDRQHCCDESNAKIYEKADEKELAELLANIPLYNEGEPHPDDDLALPPPVVPESENTSSTPSFPDGLPGVYVPPPRVVGDNPFAFTPGIPDGLPPVFDISP